MKAKFSVKSALICLVLAAIFLSSCNSRNSSAAAYEFTNITRGTIERTISASGTINPVSTVRVLPQMSGKVEKIHVDFNDLVRRGDVLAELNTDMLRLRREQQNATVMKALANYELQLMTYQNQQRLAERGFISEFELKSSETTLNNLAADLAVARSNLRTIDTEINQYAFITSPIDGIVLDRRINIGDTVADSTSSSSTNIFTLAENLREMQIEALVGELDIAHMQRGQPVRFTLESLPGRTFTGEVETLRLIPVVTNNVVSYTVIVKVDNTDGSLLPGMTCAVDFIVDFSSDVLLVPNAALRFQPSSMAEGRSTENTSIANLMMGSGPVRMGGGQGTRQGSRQGSEQAPAIVMRNIWFINGDGTLETMQVETGISTGTFTEIHVSDELEGKQIILRERI